MNVGDMVIVSIPIEAHGKSFPRDGANIRIDDEHMLANGKVGIIKEIHSSFPHFMKIESIGVNRFFYKDHVLPADNLSEDTLFDYLVQGKVNDEQYTKLIKNLQK